MTLLSFIYPSLTQSQITKKLPIRILIMIRQQFQKNYSLYNLQLKRAVLVLKTEVCIPTEHFLSSTKLSI